MAVEFDVIADVGGAKGKIGLLFVVVAAVVVDDILVVVVVVDLLVLAFQIDTNTQIEPDI